MTVLCLLVYLMNGGLVSDMILHRVPSRLSLPAMGIDSLHSFVYLFIHSVLAHKRLYFQ